MVAVGPRWQKPVFQVWKVRFEIRIVERRSRHATIIANTESKAQSSKAPNYRTTALIPGLFLSNHFEWK